MVVRFGGSRTGGEQLDLMPEKLDQAALAVRTTLVLIGTHREGSNFRPLRCHASAGAIFQKARTRPALTMPAVRYALLAPGCDLSERRGRGIGLDGQHLDQRPPDLDDGQPSMEGFDRLHPHVDHALAPFQGGKHGLNRPAKRIGHDHVFGCMTRISGQQKPFRFPFAIDEHRYPNGSDKTTAEEAGPADGGAIANGAVAAVDRQFRVRLRKRLELRLRDAVAVLAGPSWFSRPRWRRLIQGSVASDLADDDGVAREDIGRSGTSSCTRHRAAG